MGVRIMLQSKVNNCYYNNVTGLLLVELYRTVQELYFIYYLYTSRQREEMVYKCHMTLLYYAQESMNKKWRQYIKQHNISFLGGSI